MTEEIVKKQLRSLQKRILNLVYKQELLFEKCKDPNKFREIHKKMEQVKLVKVLEKYPKVEVVINLNSFNDVEKC